jgi:hypothetical protein
MDCPKCGSQILADDVNLDNLLAKCRQCQEVFSFADQVPVAANAKSAASGARVPQPEGIRVVDLGDRQRLVRRWFTLKILFLVFFCIAWDGFLVFWFWMAFGGGMGQMRSPMIIVPITHLAIGIGFTYFVLAGLFNSTVVEVGCGHLLVRHGPVPWAGGRRLSVDDIEQFYTDETVANYRSRNGYSSVYVKYNLNAVLRENVKVKLLSGLEQKDQVLFCQQQLEDWLGIQPRPVPGAL